MKYSSLIPLIAITQPAIVLAESEWQYSSGYIIYSEPCTLHPKVIGRVERGDYYRSIRNITCKEIGQEKTDKSGGKDEWLLIETKSGKRGWISRPCYLTTACVRARGLQDDCFELTVLRKFRDLYVATFAEGTTAIAEYYSFAPNVVEAIGRSGKGDSVYSAIYKDLVAPSVRLILGRAFDSAFEHYKRVSLELRGTWLV
jgi:hypothetical protein